MTVRTTVAVVPRESFSRSVESLERLLACTPEPRRIVVVDGGSPRRVADRLAELARAHRLRLVRTGYLLSPNQARNLALAHADTEYVAFVDNDLFVEPGWLAGLEAAAARSGAAVVGPVDLFGDPRQGSIRMAGGINRFVERSGGRGHEERQLFMGERGGSTRPIPPSRRCGGSDTGSGAWPSAPAGSSSRPAPATAPWCVPGGSQGGPP